MYIKNKRDSNNIKYYSPFKLYCSLTGVAQSGSITEFAKAPGNGSVSVNFDNKKPNRKSEFEYQEPSTLIASIVEREKEILKLMEEIQSGI